MKIKCGKCGSENVSGRAWVNLNDTTKFEFIDFDVEVWCDDCEELAPLETIKQEEDETT